ncbi:MAG: DUF4886 domain-containing protein [Lachnospiraceae bacterium]|nr:DUF4886 domain-containing protein [Lachnospiraceae bacterium]
MKRWKKTSALVILMLMLASCILGGCGEKGPLTARPPKSLKVLAVGGSFSIDTMEYLYDIATAAGVKEVVLGNLYNGGCSLQRHVLFYKSQQTGYSYYKNTDGEWNVTDNYTLSEALADEEWDYISLQQTSALSGLPESYETALPELISIVREKCPETPLMWHMTWAYQQDYESDAFKDYNSDQMTMYNGIVNCLNECVDKQEVFEFVIPVGTAIQNARTSFLGDTLTRDGLHLDEQIGRYIGGLTWYAAITNSSIEKIDYNPAPEMITDEMMEAAKEAVTNAILNPREVTESTY